jgi:uncharacterized protein
VILVDVNLLLHAENAASPDHPAAVTWWDAQLSADDPVCLSWPVISGFLRLVTNHRVLQRPLTADTAVKIIERWLDVPCVRIVTPTDRHWETFREMLSTSRATANLVPDAHLAALAIEHGCTLCSTDTDFGRFPRLKWKNPIAQRSTHP